MKWNGSVLYGRTELLTALVRLRHIDNGNGCMSMVATTRCGKCQIGNLLMKEMACTVFGSSHVSSHCLPPVLPVVRSPTCQAPCAAALFMQETLLLLQWRTTADAGHRCLRKPMATSLSRPSSSTRQCLPFLVLIWPDVACAGVQAYGQVTRC